MRARLLTRRAAPGLLSLALAACSPGQPHQPAEGPNPVAETIAVQTHPPKSPPADQCWGSDTLPAVFDKLTERGIVTPEVRDATGKLVRPATWGPVTRLRMVKDPTEVWFRVPCPSVETPDFWASMQRALKARGDYLQTPTGSYDAATALAVRRYQARHGLDSPVLSLAAAQDLGLVAVPLNQLP